MRRSNFLIAGFRLVHSFKTARSRCLWIAHAFSRMPRRDLALERKRLLPVFSFALIVGVVTAAGASLNERHLEGNPNVNGVSNAAPNDWEKHWAVEDGFSLKLDTQGYHFPTALAFVPHPGKRPKDPLYFVTELRGKVKVVTNDRTVYTFAENFFHPGFKDEGLNYETESGLGGICLEPSRGYVFVTFAYQDGAVLRNNIVRFETTPQTFALKPKSKQAFTDVFAPYESGVSHQIGGCRISHDMLYVGVGDGWNSPRGSQDVNVLQGKLLRMTLDGKPAPSNPFYQDDGIHNAADYVWAYGLRNPFGLEVVGKKVIVAENGVHVDRFLEVRRGVNYLWDGSDSSIATNAAYVFLDALGPAQMGYYQRTSPPFPDGFKDQFYLALSSREPNTAGILRIAYRVNKGVLVAVPQYLIKTTEADYNPLTGLAFGPDGLYFTPILPVRNGQSAVLKIKYDPQNAYPVTLADLRSAAIASADSDTVMHFMVNKGCFGCHTVKGVPGRGGTAGPALDRGNGPMIERIQQRLTSAKYLKSLQALNARDEPPFNLYEKARHEVAHAEGLEGVRIWLKYHIMEPRFDNPFSAMPNLGLTEVQAEAITRYLTDEHGRGFIGELKHKLLRNEQRRLGIAFGGGVMIGLPLWLMLSWFRRRRS